MRRAPWYYTVAACSYTFEKTEWEAPVEGHEKRLPESWTCPHESTTDSEYCPFHASDASPDDVRAAFQTALATQDEDTNSFIGATLPDLGLANEYIDTTAPIDLRAVTFTESLNLEDSRFDVPIRFEGSRFQKRLELDDTLFSREVSFYGTSFNGVVEGNGTRFEQKTSFIGAEFSYSLLLTSNTVFADDVFFTGATFQSAADFNNATMSGQAFFRDVAFHGRTSFDRAVFRDDARFAAATFTGSVSFEHAHSHGVLQFGATGINQRFDAATFDCPLALEHTTCERSVYFVDCTFTAPTTLTKSTFEDTVDLSGTTLNDGLDISRSEFTDLILIPTQVDESFLLTGDGTTLAAGVIQQPPTGGLFCTFEQATIGDIEFRATASTDDSTSRLDLSQVRFIDTTFDGFDFTSYRTGLKKAWTLDQFDTANPFEEADRKPVKRELTFMRAKSGANDIGDNRAASRFFTKEMRARGDRHKQNMHANHSIRAAGRYLGNQAFRYSSNYAENPVRVLGLSVLTIGVFAVLYAIGFQLGNHPTPYTNTLGIGYLLLSGESFVSLVHSPAATLPSTPLRALAIFEGFTGAFTIAFFLFTLTRAVHR